MFRHTSKPCLDREGNLIIPDTDNHRIRMLRRSSGDVISIIGNGKGNSKPGPAQKCSIRYPSSVHCDSAGNLLISCQVDVHMYEASTGEWNVYISLYLFFLSISGLVSLVPSLRTMTITHRTSLGRLYGYNSSRRNVISAVSMSSCFLLLRPRTQLLVFSLLDVRCQSWKYLEWLISYKNTLASVRCFHCQFST
jgi:hypothetical protein